MMTSREGVSGYPGNVPLTDQRAELGLGLQVGQAGLGDEASHIAAFLAEEKEQPLGFVSTGQRCPWQETADPSGARQATPSSLSLYSYMPRSHKFCSQAPGGPGARATAATRAAHSSRPAAGTGLRLPVNSFSRRLR